MKILVTGSAGHLGEAIMRTLRSQTDPRVQKIECIGIDQKPSNFTDETGTIVDRSFVRRCMANVDAVLHTATLHKPHIATHSRQDFVDVNV
ncbi:MAG: NAD-dependent epimerase/dehydratase family protein, partial [Planctomycetota bacterium]